MAAKANAVQVMIASARASLQAALEIVQGGLVADPTKFPAPLYNPNAAPLASAGPLPAPAYPQPIPGNPNPTVAEQEAYDAAHPLPLEPAPVAASGYIELEAELREAVMRCNSIGNSAVSKQQLESIRG
jgi:hypothetical protein